MFFRKASRPSPGWKVFEGFWFADTREWVAEHGLHQIKGAQRYFAVGLYPVTQIFNEFRMEYPYPFASRGGVLSFNFLFRQDQVPGAALLRKKAATLGSVRG